jgi:16S rRNA (adenine1518-N6/adenine1519-N6)-dimethyltransferase
MRVHREHIAGDESFFLRVIKAAFSQRRKTLRNSLSQLGYPREVMDSVPAGTGIDLGRRAETLSVTEFVLLSDFLGREHIEK